MEYALHEIGLGRYSGIHKYWTQGIQDYVLRLDQEDLEMINEYKSFFVSKPDSLCKTQGEKIIAGDSWIQLIGFVKGY